MARLKTQTTNANAHTERGMQALRTSIESDGWIGAITVAADGEAFDGSARLETGQAAFDDPIVIDSDGSRPVVVRRTDIPNADHERAIRLGVAANRVAELNLSWDVDILNRHRDLLDGGMFTDDEWAAWSTTTTDGVDIGGAGDDFDPTPDDGPTRTNLGELWLIDGGRHRLVVGDCTDGELVDRLMGGQSIDFVFTSPPYNVDVEYVDHDDRHVGWHEYGAFLEACLRAFLPHLAQGRVVGWNIGSSPRTFPHRQYCLMEDVGLTYHRTLIWQKVGVPVPLFHTTRDAQLARHFMPNYTHELVGLFTKGEIERGGAVSFGDVLQHDVFSIRQNLSTIDLPDDPTAPRTGVRSHLDTRARKVHPAPFPIELPRAFIDHLADVDAVVYDPFAGAGTTMIAAHATDRRSASCEIAPKYADVILRRAEAAGLTCERAP